MIVRRFLSLSAACALLMLLASPCFAQAGIDNTGKAPVLIKSKLPNGVEISYVRVPLDKFDIRVLAARVPMFERAQQVQNLNPERASSGYSLREYLGHYGALAVLSGGYIDSYSPPTPLGLVRSNGLQISGIHNSWLVDGLFCSNPGHAEITLVDMDPMRQNFRDCVQSGPLLLLDKEKPNSPSREENPNYKKFAAAPIERTFLCLNGDGEAVLGISGKIELPKLVAALRGPEYRCTNAIGFTGAVSGGLRIGDKLVGKDDFLFPSVIAVMPLGR
jgi:hypothetical protein